MERKSNGKLVPLARQLRKNMTKEERRLWFDYLREYPRKFVRQKIVGRYILDFYCAQAKLAVEVDGSQHYEPAGAERDRERTKYLEGFGITVIRIPNNELMHNFRGACEYIDLHVKRRMSLTEASS
ncbi:MAG: endonuclease domain-containing protein [Oscillospiraceae bacterium]|nr:endonuclease domain-containing protein [Oscillospiraceae bacterium]